MSACTLAHLVDILQGQVVQGLNVLRDFIVHTLSVTPQVIVRRSSTHHQSSG